MWTRLIRIEDSGRKSQRPCYRKGLSWKFQSILLIYIIKIAMSIMKSLAITFIFFFLHLNDYFLLCNIKYPTVSENFELFDRYLLVKWSHWHTRTTFSTAKNHWMANKIFRMEHEKYIHECNQHGFLLQLEVIVRPLLTHLKGTL
jgi:hypothetical protein